MPDATWATSLHLSFRLLPAPSTNLRPFLEGEGLSKGQLLQKLPYARSRSKTPGAGPDPRRYRDGKQLYETVGFIYEDSVGTVRVTNLGRATLRWLDIMNEKNVSILGRHAAYALAACQLKNPTGWGSGYDVSVQVFPFAFIWRAMLQLDGRINSEELNRAIFRVKNETELEQAIADIISARKSGDLTQLGAEVTTGEGKDDRIIPWMSMASFGWTLLSDKRSGNGDYTILPRSHSVIAEAAAVHHRHKEFATTEEYVRHIDRAAALPKDLR